MTTPAPPGEPPTDADRAIAAYAPGGSGNTSGGSIIDDVSGAVGGAVGSALGLGAVVDAIGTVFNWVVERISAGLAHFANVALNNLLYGSMVLVGSVIAVGGFIMLMNATPAGAAVRGVAGGAAGIATKVLPI